MGIFRQGAQSFLPDRDYLPLALPTTGIATLWTLTRTGGALHRFGPLVDLFSGSSDALEAAVERGATVAASAGHRSRQYKGSLSLAVANTLLQTLGADPRVNLSRYGAKSVTFDYVGLAADTVRISKLDDWLSRAELATDTSRIATLLVAERIYVVVSALYATGINMTLGDAAGQAVSAGVSALQSEVGGEVSVTSAAGNTSTLQFSGSTPLVIAAKAAQIRLDPDGFWVEERPANSGEIRSLGGVSYLDGDELQLS